MTWILVDAQYLCYRAFYTTGGLKHQGKPTGVVFGFLREIIKLVDLFSPDGFVFCFDSRHSLRKREYPKYKENRNTKPMTAEEIAERQEFRNQVTELRRTLLQRLGFANILHKKGYEADDLIANAVQQLKDKVEGCSIVIVSADKDLYQLLQPDVLLWNPHKQAPYTDKSFRREWGLEPSAWIEVKAIAGCGTDNIKGIKGVAEKTAAKFVSGNLRESTAAFQSIVAKERIWRRNRRLVELPFPGKYEDIQLVEDGTLEATLWDEVLDELGFVSMKRLRGMI